MYTIFCVFCSIVLFCVFVGQCVMYYCHTVTEYRINCGKQIYQYQYTLVISVYKPSLRQYEAHFYQHLS
jgi:hypothetical protein